MCSDKFRREDTANTTYLANVKISAGSVRLRLVFSEGGLGLRSTLSTREQETKKAGNNNNQKKVLLYLYVVGQAEEIGELGDDRLGGHVAAGEDAVALEGDADGVGAEADAPSEALSYGNDQDVLGLGHLCLLRAFG